MARDDTPAPVDVPAIVQAKERTEELQQTLEITSAELNLTNTALNRHIPTAPRHDDVDRALEQNVAIETKVQEAAEELAEVSELLAREVIQRRHLERRLALAQRGPH